MYFLNSIRYNASTQLKNYLSRGLMSKIQKMAGKIIWMDLEMTGLDLKKDTILEIACIITDGQLNIIAEGPDIIIQHEKSVLDNMDSWCIENHGKTGLTQASLDSKISLENAEKEILRFLRTYTNSGTCPLAGNSVYTDRMFLQKYMPKLNSYMHYRIIDVSTLKELCKRWTPDIYNDAPKKKLEHRALSDIKESINELKYYKDKMIINRV